MLLWFVRIVLVYLKCSYINWNVIYNKSSIVYNNWETFHFLTTMIIDIDIHIQKTCFYWIEGSKNRHWLYWIIKPFTKVPKKWFLNHEKIFLMKYNKMLKLMNSKYFYIDLQFLLYYSIYKIYIKILYCIKYR